MGPGQIEVAVKILKDESEKVKLLKEAAIMGQFAHPNIVQLYGLTTITEPVSVHSLNYARLAYYRRASACAVCLHYCQGFG